MFEEDIDSVVGEMEYEGERITPLRRGIIGIFLTRKTPLTPSEVATILLKRKISFHKASLYRELEFLISWNFLERVMFADDAVRYETTWRKHHHHLVCTKCTDVVDVELPESPLEKTAETIAMKHSFSIQSHSLEFFGLCQKCQFSR